jgi:hypothetical protein
MDPQTCAQVQDEIELYAAGECDSEMAALVSRHVAACPACAKALEESRQMLGLLELRLREPDGLERLRDRLHVEERRRRSARFLTFARVAAVAAVLLLIVGVYTWVASTVDRGPGTPAVVAAAQIGPGAGAIYQVRTTHDLDLQRGDVQVRVAPSGEKSKAFQVHTPGGIVSAEQAEFLVQTPKDGRGPATVKVLAGTVTLKNANGGVELRRGESGVLGEGAAPAAQVEDLTLRFGRGYEPAKAKTAGRVPATPLPVDLDKVPTYAALAKLLEPVEKPLRTHGFAVLPNAGGDDLVSAYKTLADLDVPTLVTSDTILHLSRLHLAWVLRDLEERVLIDDLDALTKALTEDLLKSPPPGKSEDWKAAYLFALAYLQTANKLLHPDKIGLGGMEEAEAAHFVLRTARSTFYVTFDDADFEPTGHYRATARLRAYYRAQRWYSSVPLRLNGFEAQRQTMAACLLARAVQEAKLPDGRPALAVWKNLAAITAFFAGPSDDPGPLQYQVALQVVPTAATDDGFRNFKRAVLQGMPPPLFTAVQATPPKVGSPEDADKNAAPDAGFRLFGRRRTAAALLLGKLVYPNLGPAKGKAAFTTGALPDGNKVRTLPRGLDLFAILGSPLALKKLQATGDADYTAGPGALSYDEALAKLRAELATFDAVDWNRDLSWAWLYALKPLLPEPAAGSPTFAAAPTYRTQKLVTALAAWTQARADTVLYARKVMQGADNVKSALMQEMVSPPAPSRQHPPPAYLEPAPELYGRLLALTRMTRKQLAALGCLSPEAGRRLADLEEALATAVQLAEKELADEPLTADEQAAVRRLPERLRLSATTAPDEARLDKLTAGLMEAKLKRDDKAFAELREQVHAEEYGGVAAPAVVTVAEDAIGQTVLQEAVGRADLAVAVVRLPGGKLMLAAGPVFSYYEFRRPRSEALTLETWRAWLEQTPGPPRLAWE